MNKVYKKINIIWDFSYLFFAYLNSVKPLSQNRLLEVSHHFKN